MRILFGVAKFLSIFFRLYSTAQLQGNIRTHLESVQDASKMHARCIQNTHEMHPC